MREVPHLSELVPHYDEPEIYTPALNPCRQGCDPEGCRGDCNCECHSTPEFWSARSWPNERRNQMP